MGHAGAGKPSNIRAIFGGLKGPARSLGTTLSGDLATVNTVSMLEIQQFEDLDSEIGKLIVGEHADVFGRARGMQSHRIECKH